MFNSFKLSVNELSRFRRILSRDPKAPGYIQKTNGSWTESSLEFRPEGDKSVNREIIDEIVTIDKVRMDRIFPAMLQNLSDKVL